MNPSGTQAQAQVGGSISPPSIEGNGPPLSEWEGGGVGSRHDIKRGGGVKVKKGPRAMDKWMCQTNGQQTRQRKRVTEWDMVPFSRNATASALMRCKNSPATAQ